MKHAKHYLNGIDWVTQSLNHQCRKTASGSNSFVVALEVEGTVSGEELTNLLSRTKAVLPLLAGKTVRQKLHLAPYWKFAKNPHNISVEELEFAPLEQLIEDFIVQPFYHQHEHIAVGFAPSASGTAVLFKFDHRLFDGGGAELFLAELNRSCETNTTAEFNMPDCSSPQLSQWADKFDSGKNVNRFVRSITENNTRKPFTFYSPGAKPAAANRFRILNVTATQAEAFFALGEQKLGPFMDTPFLAAVIFNSLAALAVERGTGADDYLLLPMTVDLRTPHGDGKQLFFNQWSVAPLKLDIAAALELDSGMTSLKEQFVELVKNKFLSDLNKANLLMRIVPLPWYSCFTANVFSGTNGSCSFAYLSDPGFKSDTFMGKKVKNLLHLPTIPPTPGIGIFINKHNGNLNIVLSYREGIISDAEIATLFASLQNAFKAPFGQS